MQYFRFLPDSGKLRKEPRWSGVSSVPGICERVQPSADIGAGTVTAYFVDNGRRRHIRNKLRRTIKLRRAGFPDCIVTEEKFCTLFDQLRHKRIIP
jgi:hypothetical protein